MPIIDIDSKEASQHPEFVEQLKKFATVRIIAMPDCLDFVINAKPPKKNLAIQRMTFSDLLGKLASKTLINQIEGLKTLEEDGFDVVLVIEAGYIALMRKVSDWNETSLNRLLYEILHKYHITALYTIDSGVKKNKAGQWYIVGGTIGWMLSTAKDLESPDEPREYSLRTGISKEMTLPEKQEYLLDVFGHKTGINLLKYFQTPQRISNATEDELKKVDLVGDIIARNIREIMTTPYKIMEEKK